jgi:hypothetical protein
MSDEKKIDDGGPAFPWHSDGMAEHYPPSQGMTLRDYFAAKAIAALIPLEDLAMRSENMDDRTGFDDQPWADQSDISYADRLAEDAYIIAEAMLAVRNRFAARKQHHTG